jgi:hypothetical protein
MSNEQQGKGAGVDRDSNVVPFPHGNGRGKEFYELAAQDDLIEQLLGEFDHLDDDLFEDLDDSEDEKEAFAERQTNLNSLQGQLEILKDQTRRLSYYLDELALFRKLT